MDEKLVPLGATNEEIVEVLTSFYLNLCLVVFGVKIKIKRERTNLMFCSYPGL